MASVALHPLASRTGKQTSTIVSVDVPTTADRTPVLSSSAPLDRHNTSSHDDDEPFGSSPTARANSPNPFAAANEVAADAANANDREWGLHHEDLDGAYPIITAGSSAEPSDLDFPVRAMTAEQFANLHRQYVELDVPHSALFPFLHGVDGDNPAQCAFFHAPLSGQPTPHYRGLTVVRADMPPQDFQQRRRDVPSSSSVSKLSTYSSQRSRTDSLVSSSNFSVSSTSSEEEDDVDEEREFEDSVLSGAAIPGHEDDEVENVAGEAEPSDRAAPKSIVASHSTSSGSSSASESRASSLFSFAGSDTTMSTQIEGDAYKAAEAAALHARESRQKRAEQQAHHRQSHRQHAFVEPQPVHSMLVSTVLPDEIINPPLIANTVANSLDVAQQCQVIEDERSIVKGATFVRPRQAEGISLRNFKTQCAKYATISDIVVYCPAGFHRGALNLAKWVAEAQEACYAQRHQRNLGSIRYNVFLVTDPFEVFERSFPHLIAVDGSGFSRQRVDFIDREREEMQRFTSASEIEENVFLGCSANVPVAMDDMEGSSSLSLDSYLPLEVNPHAFSICIETTEHAEMPSPSRLSHASHYLDAFEATTLFEIDSQDALRDLHETANNEEDEDGQDADDSVRPSLGPSGWSPSQVRSNGSGTNGSAKPAKDSQTHKTAASQAQQQLLCPAPSNMVHLRALGSGTCFEDYMSEEEGIESIVQLCAWIYRQAKPSCASKSPQALAQQQQGSSMWRSNRTSSWPKHQQQLPRRVLIHCSDGYTDSSILGLAYLMYSRNLTLPQAYLDLQNRCERCFFIYARDVPFLQRLEKRMIMEQQQLRMAAERQRNSWSASYEDRIPRRLGSLSNRRDHHEPSANVRNSGLLSSDQSVWSRGLAAATGLVSSVQQHGNHSLSGKRSMDIVRTTTPTPRHTTPTPQSPSRGFGKAKGSASVAPNDSWFHHPQFQGSFPSRILPFLYLGNLSHAMNPGMLHALGITHVVSVGESALIPPLSHEDVTTLGDDWGKGSSSPSRKRRSMPYEPNSLWEEERAGRISVLDLKNVSDDGIDSLRPHINRAIEYIEQARLQGGKVLVHCRVGVSRSATVCIAYVMAHCDLSMIESFLLVRSRRMNVLTQPTLLFVWELRGVEAHLIRLKQRRQQQQRQLNQTGSSTYDSNGDSEMHDIDDGFSLAALSISSAEASHDDDVNTLRARNRPAGDRLAVAKPSSPLMSSLTANRQSIFSDEDLRVEIGAGAGSVYGFDVRDSAERDFNSGSLTRLDYRAARLTHGSFCKLLSELNARYMVA